VIVGEAVRGHVPPLWFWALPGIDRIRAFDQSQLPSPPSPVSWEYGRAKAGQTFYEGPTDVHVVGRNASNTEPARFVVVLLKAKGAPVLTPVKED